MSSVYQQLPLFPLEKRCTRCDLVKSIGEFPMQHRSGYGRPYFAFKPVCYACNRERERQTWPQRARAQEARARRAQRALVPEKRCSRCGEVKPRAAFRPRPERLCGISSWCKDCYRAYERDLDAARRALRRVVPEEKRCRKCGRDQPSTAFGRSSTSSDGLVTRCKACTRAAEHAKRPPHHIIWPQLEQQSLAAQGLRRCTKCREAKPLDAFYPTKANRAGRMPHCKDCHRAAVNARAAADNYEYGRAYYAANRERLRMRMRERGRAKWRERRASKMAWASANPERTRSYSKHAKARRRALLARVGGTHTAKDIRLLYQQQAGCCAYCGATLTQRYTIDHIVPLTRGGSNDLANLCIACTSCNSSKGAKLLSEWCERPYTRTAGAP